MLLDLNALHNTVLNGNGGPQTGKTTALCYEIIGNIELQERDSETYYVVCGDDRRANLFLESFINCMLDYGILKYAVTSDVFRAHEITFSYNGKSVRVVSFGANSHFEKGTRPEVFYDD